MSVKTKKHKRIVRELSEHYLNEIDLLESDLVSTEEAVRFWQQKYGDFKIMSDSALADTEGSFKRGQDYARRQMQAYLPNLASDVAAEVKRRIASVEIVPQQEAEISG